MTLSKLSAKLSVKDLSTPFFKKMFEIIIFFIEIVILCLFSIFNKTLKANSVTNIELKYLKAQLINIKEDPFSANCKKPYAMFSLIESDVCVSLK